MPTRSDQVRWFRSGMSSSSGPTTRPSIPSRAAAPPVPAEIPDLSRRPDIPPRMGGRPIFAPDITFEDFATKWTSGELHRLFPKRIRAKRTADQDAWMLRRWVFPRLDRCRLPHHVRRLRRCARRHPGDAIGLRRAPGCPSHRACLAARGPPGRVLKDCPVPRGFVPPILKQRARTYLFPEEDRRLLACPKIALIKRLLYGILDREGLRVEEALSLDLADLDATNGALNLDRNKTNDPARVGAPPKRRRRASSLASPLPPKPGAECAPLCPPARAPAPGSPSDRGRRSGANTSEGARKGRLRAEPAFREQRGPASRSASTISAGATFVTIPLATGKTEPWIAERTGHRSSKMIYRYRRLASCHRELNLGPLDPLVDAIPELHALRDAAAH